MSEWISVKDRLPKPYERVLTYRKDYAIDTETYKGKFGKNIMWSWDVEAMTPVTHWMPLPEPPKEVE